MSLLGLVLGSRFLGELSRGHASRAPAPAIAPTQSVRRGGGQIERVGQTQTAIIITTSGEVVNSYSMKFEPALETTGRGCVVKLEFRIQRLKRLRKRWISLPQPLKGRLILKDLRYR
jgi:hypothetical protein